MSREERQRLVNESYANLSITRQCELLNVNRSTFYYHTVEVDQDDVALMNEIREIWASIPFYGYRRITRELMHKGYCVNRKRVQRLMRIMGIQAVFPKPKLSLKNKQHEIYPYLLNDLEINRVNQVWSVDITYLKLGCGFMYLVALIDVYSRYIVGWELSNTLEADCCVEMLNRALRRVSPEIINSDQGSQFTGADWTNALRASGIKISMDGKGRCLDNIYIERFWRSFKYEDFHLNDYQTVPELRKGVESYIDFYNNRRWHQGLKYKTPAEIYNKKPVDLWTSPSDQPEPCGTCGKTDGQNVDNIKNMLPTLLPTALPHSLVSRPRNPQAQ